MAYHYRTLLATTLSGAILAIAQLIAPLAFLTFLGLVPLIYSCSKIVEKDSNKKDILKKLFWHSWIAGLIYFGVTFFWIWSAYPLNAFGIDSNIHSFIIIAFIWISSIVAIAAFWGLFGISFWLSRNRKILWQILIIAAAFTIIEYFRAYSFSLIFLGSGTLFGPYFTYGNLAYNFATSPIIRLSSSVIGIYGITFCIAFINALFYILFFKKRRFLFFISLTISILLLSIPFDLEITENKKNIHFGLIQTNDPTQLEYIDNDHIRSLAIQQSFLKIIARDHPKTDIIVMPETSNFFQNLAITTPSDKAKEYLANLFLHSTLLISSNRYEDRLNHKIYSREYSYDTKRGLISSYDKRLLAPIGEFMPYILRGLVNILTQTITKTYADGKGYDNGEKTVSTFLFNDNFTVAPLICSEILSPSFVRKATKGSDILTLQASNGIFRGSSQIIQQHLAQARFRAAENKKPVLVAANEGISYALDSNGSFIAIAQDQTPQILTGVISFGKSKSWYNYLGDLPILLSSFLIIAYHYFRHNLRN